MKALCFRHTGSLANLRVENVEVPRIDTHGEALVQVRAAAINPNDPKSVPEKFKEPPPMIGFLLSHRVK